MTTGLLVLASTIVRVGATQGGPPTQTPPPTPPTTQAPPQGQGGAPPGRGRGPGTFPNQQRPLAPPEVIARGKGLYETSCRACHGADLRGGDMGGPNLLRSEFTLNDVDGETIGPVIRDGRPNMPGLDVTPDDGKAIAAYIRSVLASARGQGAPPAGPRQELNIVVGNAAAGQAFFNANCSTCHSVTGDLKGIATRIAEPIQLQNAWVSGRGAGRGGRGRGGGGGEGGAAPTAPDRREVTVTVTLASGEKVTGRLGRIDDFLVTLTDANGRSRSFRRDGDLPKVEINDPLAQHKKLLLIYTDKNIHDVTAYLVTLK
jgi:cytochrome c oxidase cbb3-type subunit 3